MIYGTRIRLRAIRAYEKCDFVQEGCLRQARFKGGAYYDVWIMSILRPEWEKRRGKPCQSSTTK
uniref:Acetyltransferase, GNAT family n=1 Tax=uncultured Chloroflexota bacterium TaxID=166587 RepID=H5SK89_9CHLR|nr:GNAT family acetyltransferase [uncultured bacterium]BAL56575.1 acetyltransferase, GNAT family [uncultured Chloroflexota bacterium]